MLALTRNAQPSPPLIPNLQRAENLHETNDNDFALFYPDIRASIVLPYIPLDAVHTMTLYHAGQYDAGTDHIRAQCMYFSGVERLRLSIPSCDIHFLADPNLLPRLRYLDMDPKIYDLRIILTKYASQGTPIAADSEPFLAFEDGWDYRLKYSFMLRKRSHS